VAVAEALIAPLGLGRAGCAGAIDPKVIWYSMAETRSGL